MSYRIKGPLMTPGSNVVSTNGRGVLWLDKEGILYGTHPTNNYRWGGTVEKSEDWGETWTTLHTVSEEYIRQIRKLNDGSVMAFGSLGGVYKSDENEQNFQLVHRHDEGKSMNEGFGVKVYDNILLICEYGTNYGHQVYMSKDYGETFESIFLNPNPKDHHIHDVAYDPYEGLIWVACGDNPPNDMIFWSADWGKTWRNLNPGIDKQRRVTMIMPMPDCVLFGTDEHHLLGVYRHDRPESGTMTKDVDPYPAWSALDFYHQYTDVNPKPWVTQAAITDDGAAYFGFLMPNGYVKLPSQIWATKTG